MPTCRAGACGSALLERGKVEMPGHAGEQQRAEVELQDEFAAADQRGEFGKRD